MNGMAPLDDGTRNLISEDLFNNSSEFMNFDTHGGWFNSPSATDQMFASCGFLDSQPFLLAESRILCWDFFLFCETNWHFKHAAGTSYSSGDKLALQQAGNSHFVYSSDLMDADDLGAKQSNGAQRQSNVPDMANCIITKAVGFSLDEKMLRALSLLKESAGWGILAQVWVPIRHGDQYIMTTFEQPYVLDQPYVLLANYREVSGYREVYRTYTFPMSLDSKSSEWASNIKYLGGKHACHHKVRGSIALPILGPLEMSCCAVLELVTVKEKPNFDSEMENVCLALQAVNLRSTSLSRNQRAALDEITDVLRVVCHARSLPLALKWIPCNYVEEAVDEIIKVHVRVGNSRSSGKFVLCIEGTACHVHDREMQGFVYACSEHYIEEGQGIAGKALQSNHPFFFADLKAYDITEYPLVHRARKYGLNAAVAIRIRSTYTGNSDYILEFFLSVSMKGSSEQQLLLNNLSGTMQRICKSLRTVSDAELVGGESSKVEFQKEAIPRFPPMSVSISSSQTTFSEANLNLTNKIPFDASSSKYDEMESDGPCEQAIKGSRRQLEKKRSIAEKNVSLSVLQQYFYGSLKDAAKSIGVCPTTLKRICRQHGISRWPSRKINKVNSSLKKIQTVVNSVQGVEGGLKFDPTTGGFVAASSIVQEFDSPKSFLFSDRNLPAKNSESATEDAVSVPPAPCIHGKVEEEDIPVIDCSEDSKSISTDAGICQSLGSGPWASMENASMFGRGGKGSLNPGSMKLENSDTHLVSRSLCSWGAAEDLDTKMEGVDGMVEHNQPTCSSITESSNDTGSMIHGSTSSSTSLEWGEHSKVKYDDGGSKITVKATYKEDIIRFKFKPSVGCFQLYEEVAKRFKLQNGAFQLKYLDDEQEWVMLVSDSDLQECVEILDYVGTRSVKFLVHDTVSFMGSSGSSNCFLGGSS
ncbi:hypothetical protein P3X46_000353 [Hevea brasiliensis]|uniref:RWP-RK domain-containing protein n=1 Tax=Hevea brasiliensis TaxID=3981 RepID=A0ABQ9NCP7_HEVBR|nr:hypothetical protein P3X46_000353 [Hevea brasiliensis]